MDATASGVGTTSPMTAGSAPDTMIRLTGVGKTYPDGTVAVHELDLDVRRGEMVCLVGPSGCGKSTTLKMINRLIEPTTGRIWLDGKDVTDVDPVELRRGIGYVIQQIGLFPHQQHRAERDDRAAALRRVEVDRSRARPRAAQHCRPRSRPVRRSLPAPSSPAGSASASAWPARSPPTRRCC